jgi:hypothetical protein
MELKEASREETAAFRKNVDALVKQAETELQKVRDKFANP